MRKCCILLPGDLVNGDMMQQEILRALPGFAAFFSSFGIYCPEWIKKGGRTMHYSDDPNADLEDLIYDEDSGHPSER